jgi:polysaccharide chain length determinant protein (PEP-CTERM system associated)
MDEVFRKARITLRGIWNHRWLGLAVAWAVGAAALATLVVMPARYEATARIFANTDSILKPLMTGMTVQPNDDQRIVMLSRVVISRPNVEKIVETVGLDAGAKSQEERERIIDNVIKTLEFKGTGRDNLYTITFRDVDPARAKNAVDLLATMFIESSKGGKERDTDAAKKFIDEQIAVYEKKLQEAENRLKEFRLRYLGMTPGEGKDYFVRMSETNGLLTQARLELREAENARDAFRRGLASEEPAGGAGGSIGSGTMIADINARIDTLKRDLDAQMQRFTENHPDVRGTQRMIRDLEEQKRALIASGRRDSPATLPSSITGPRAAETLKVSLAQSEAAVASLRTRVAEYSARYERLKASATLVPQLEAEYAQLNRDYDVNKKNFESLVSRRESASISGEMQSVAGVSDFRLVDPPRVSPNPVSPNRRLLVPLALIFALACGIGASYVANEARTTFHDARTLREATGLPMLGSVSLLVSDPARVATRRNTYRFVGGVTALLAIYVIGFVALEMFSVRVV